jgi:hypothetical protein
MKIIKHAERPVMRIMKFNEIFVLHKLLSSSKTCSYSHLFIQNAVDIFSNIFISIFLAYQNKKIFYNEISLVKVRILILKRLWINVILAWRVILGIISFLYFFHALGYYAEK